LGQSQHICGIVIPLFLPTFHHLPEDFQLIVPVTDTVYSVVFHIHTIPVTIYSKYNPYGSDVKVQLIVNGGYFLCEDARAVARRSVGIFRFQPLAAIPIPTSVSMNIVAAVSTGDLNDGIMIGE
jgi:hypothetical protein